MFENTRKYLRKWNMSYDERKKLQHVLLVLSSIGVLSSALIALIDADLGHTLVRLSLFGYVVVAVNWVIWSLTKTTLLESLNKRPVRKTRK